MVDKWPDDKLEAVMIKDAERSYDPYVPLHVKALVGRVRWLESKLYRAEECIRDFAWVSNHGADLTPEFVLSKAAVYFGVTNAELKA